MLLLLPNLLSPEALPEDVFTPSIHAAVQSLHGLIAESPKGGRQFLKQFKRLDLPQALLNEHTSPAELQDLLLSLKKGERWGLVSDCGLPCLSDPGAALVKEARAINIGIQAFSGPSSIPLALMLSGLPAQNFTFHGYLSREPERLLAQLLALEKQNTTHVFIEAPYRNEKLLALLLKTLAPTTHLCIAWDLMAPTQGVLSCPIRQFKTLSRPSIDKKPAIFLFHS